MHIFANKITAAPDADLDGLLQEQEQPTIKLYMKLMYILLSEFLYSLQFLRPPYANEDVTRGTRMTPRKQQVSKLIGDCPSRGRPFQTRIWVCPHLD